MTRKLQIAVAVAFFAFLAILVQRPFLDTISIASEVLAAQKPAACRCTRDATCWPTISQWSHFNATVGGRLLSSPPLGASCHTPQYDANLCTQIREGWLWPGIHIADPVSVMNPYFQGQWHPSAADCSPFTDAGIPCNVDQHTLLAINITSAEDVVASLEFARKHSLRIVIKNTGHEYTGKSASHRNTLTLWTHHLNSATEISAYSSPYHNGTALRLGAGILAVDALAAARQHGVRFAGGFCPSVGTAGGYIQGGGHGPLSSAYGMAADNVLEWEVVTAAGDHIVASPTRHEDLYWALAGGGGGTFGVVISVTVRVFPDDEPVGGSSMIMLRSAQPNEEVFWESFRAWHSVLPSLLETGATAGYAITGDALIIQPLTIPGASQLEMQTLLSPFTNRLDGLNASYNLRQTSLPSYYEHFETYAAPLPWGPFNVDLLFGGKIIPRRVLYDQQEELQATVRHLIENTRAFLGFVAVNVDPNHPGGPNVPAVAPNAVLPAWRHAGLTVLAQSQWNLTAPREDSLARAREMTDVVVPALAKLGGRGQEAGTYLNEADPGLKDWRREFYGSSWERLMEVKRTWDPDSVFWAPMTVGSDAWALDDKGALCRVDWHQRLRVIWTGWWDQWRNNLDLAITP